MKTEIRQAYIDTTTGKIVHAHNLIDILDPISFVAFFLGIYLIFMSYYVVLKNFKCNDDEVNKSVDEDFKFFIKGGVFCMLLWAVTHWYIINYLT